MSNPNKSLVVPPPPESSDSEFNPAGGAILDIPADCVVDFSHTYLAKSIDPCKDCLFVIQVRERGSMKMKWADPDWKTDDQRVIQFNNNLDSGKIIIIGAKEILLNGAHGEAQSIAFWNYNGMGELPKETYAPQKERWADFITEKTNSIQIVDGYVKIVDLS